MEFYTDSQREVQAKFDCRPLADRLTETIIVDAIEDFHREFIESRDFFFLSTVNGRGEPTVSYKGGAVGLVTVLDPQTVVFPNYDGNGMFLSMGNIAETAKIGLLFIDFETPNRIRIQATARLVDDDPEMQRYPGALQLVRASVDSVYLNCARLIHQHTRVETSPYVPDAAGATPYPAWKRIDIVQDVLRPGDQGRADDEGGVITTAQYGEKLAAGQS
ncbi:pyridoxamine 5'-phosphate oxidase family protein [Candidatus Poriferisodalis sp.]|uniref:pyridoxamine 5'-phosphate oxidase family protein n=1 Tax=Candidatus Poriferisodalis sp. TaxID=3101277 RepID=UPI003B02B136